METMETAPGDEVRALAGRVVEAVHASHARPPEGYTQVDVRLERLAARLELRAGLLILCRLYELPASGPERDRPLDHQRQLSVLTLETEERRFRVICYNEAPGETSIAFESALTELWVTSSDEIHDPDGKEE